MSLAIQSTYTPLPILTLCVVISLFCTPANDILVFFFFFICAFLFCFLFDVPGAILEVDDGYIGYGARCRQNRFSTTDYAYWEMMGYDGLSLFWIRIVLD